MLKNFWYACELSQSVTRKPKRVTLMNQDFVLYRNQMGEVVVLKDRCPHLGAALSHGQVEEDFIRCPYHGWKFRADGSCIEIPANLDGVPIPKKACVESYRVQEQFGIVWLFWGNLPLEESPPLPSIPTFGHPDFRSFSFSRFFRVHYSRLLEINLDFAHPPFVHGRSFGSRMAHDPTISEYKVHSQDWGGYASYKVKKTKPKGLLWQYFQHQTEPKVTLTFQMPNNFQVEIDFGSWKLIKFSSYTPIDEQTTVSREIYMRNFLTHPLMNSLFEKFEAKLAREDLRVVETVRPKVVPYDFTDEVFLPSDALLITYRKLRKKCRDLGWAINSDSKISSYPTFRTSNFSTPSSISNRF